MSSEEVSRERQTTIEVTLDINDDIVISKSLPMLIRLRNVCHSFKWKCGTQEEINKQAKINDELYCMPRYCMCG